eukprot:Mycagemm_TRINITY_DN10163_c0_g1::TRINITY_DN10163_c0_g1_i2::g.5303::m.5303 type:complete len:121 gc:universal TRINITY_DN10163_c0_g1_i2:694-332(-)
MSEATCPCRATYRCRAHQTRRFARSRSLPMRMARPALYCGSTLIWRTPSTLSAREQTLSSRRRTGISTSQILSSSGRKTERTIFQLRTLGAPSRSHFRCAASRCVPRAAPWCSGCRALHT